MPAGRVTDCDRQGVEQPVTHPHLASPLRLDPKNGLSQQAAVRYLPPIIAHKGGNLTQSAPGPNTPQETPWKVARGLNAPPQHIEPEASEETASKPNERHAFHNFQGPWCKTQSLWQSYCLGPLRGRPPEGA